MATTLAKNFFLRSLLSFLIGPSARPRPRLATGRESGNAMGSSMVIPAVFSVRFTFNRTEISSVGEALQEFGP